jgi:hypothetical protein
VRPFLAMLILALLIGWLPLQPMAALAMPFCQHGTQPSAMEHDHASVHHAGHEPQHTDGQAGHLACSDCGACHLACAPVLTVSLTLSAHVPARRFDLSPPLVPAAFAPEQPHPPPLAH